MASATINLDQAAVPAGTPEELAGPPLTETTRPVEREERLSTIDVLRGVAIMGILVMNSTDFAYGFANYAYPLSTVKPVFSGPHWLLNTVIWFARWIFAEGKMRAMLSLLFGAGVILMTARAESRGAGVRTADIYTRRNMWLFLIGMLHCYLIWNGDILFFYAVAALIFLFPFRNLKPKTLFLCGGILLGINNLVINGGQTAGVAFSHYAYVKAEAKLAAHKTLTEDEKNAIGGWHAAENRYRLPQADIYKDIAKHHNWPSAQGADIKQAMQGETKGPYFGFGDWVGMMLLGMAFFKNGFLSGKLKTKTYVLFAVICLGIAWPLTFLEAWKAWKSHFDYLTTMLWMQAPYDIGRVAGALGTAALLILIVRSGLLKWPLARLANVGQMALTNYLLTSLTMRTLFVWSRPHWYGYMEYYKLYILVLCVWACNILLSTLWLKYFRFGPVEWVWRSLTYWKKQPMLLTPKPAPAPTPTFSEPEPA